MITKTDPLIESVRDTNIGAYYKGYVAGIEAALSFIRNYPIEADIKILDAVRHVYDALEVMCLCEIQNRGLAEVERVARGVMAVEVKKQT